MSLKITLVALHPADFEVHLLVSGFEDLDTTITDLVARGYRPARSGDLYARTPEGLPLCPKHGVPMRERNKQNDTWYSHAMVHPQTGEELYCRGHAGSNSPGWEIAACQRSGRDT
jgi:hypothetical protein